MVVLSILFLVLFVLYTGYIIGLATNSDNPNTATRSLDSTIKLLLDYAPAVEYAGLTPDTIQNGNLFSVRNWKVKNYGNVKAS